MSQQVEADKELYETLGTIADALYPHLRPVFAELVRNLIFGHPYGTRVVLRWLRDAGYNVQAD